MDLLVFLVSLLGYVFHYRRLGRAYGKIKQTMEERGDLGWLFAQLRERGEDGVPGIGIMKEIVDYERENFSLKESDYQQRMNDLKDYLTQTVHDLKVNLSVCEMVVRTLEIEVDSAEKLFFQIEQMKFRVNQALSITRANHYSEDIVSEVVNLEEVVKEAIGDNAEFFISKNISIQKDLKPYRFISDKKWIHYIITQILNNSYKYTHRNGEITIFSREDEEGYHLHLRDNGIGIPKEEVNRVFDKGFTGSNGRSSIRSTGMGMYYAKRMADTLGIGLQVESKRGGIYRICSIIL